MFCRVCEHNFGPWTTYQEREMGVCQECQLDDTKMEANKMAEVVTIHYSCTQCKYSLKDEEKVRGICAWCEKRASQGFGVIGARTSSTDPSYGVSGLPSSGALRKEGTRAVRQVWPPIVASAAGLGDTQPISAQAPTPAPPVLPLLTELGVPKKPILITAGSYFDPVRGEWVTPKEPNIVQKVRDYIFPAVEEGGEG